MTIMASLRHSVQGQVIVDRIMALHVSVEKELFVNHSGTDEKRKSSRLSPQSLSSI
jgi:hypothetical protein